MRKINVCLIVFILLLFSCNSKPQTAIKIDPSAIELCDSATDIFFNSNYDIDSLKKAVVLLSEAIAIDSTYILAYANKAQYLSAMGQTPLALDVILQAQRVDPENPHLYVSQGLFAEKLGMLGIAYKAYDNAIMYCDKRIRTEPEKWIYKVEKIFINLLISNNTDLAIKEFEILKDKFQNNPEEKMGTQLFIDAMATFNRKDYINNTYKTTVAVE